MDTARSQEVTTRPSPEERVADMFTLRAESLRDRTFELFTEPSYLPELTTSQACALIGGRGTGKTTVLKCLSYQGRFALSHGDAEAIPTWPYYGVYHRVNTNRVTAFAGAELPEAKWIKVFAHYLNLLFSESALAFLEWYELHTNRGLVLSTEIVKRIATSLHVKNATTLRALGDGLTNAVTHFESFINNVADADMPPLSLQGQPLDLLFAALGSTPEFQGKRFFFLIDELENLLDYQMRVLNTLIKHGGEHYTFKVGVKELGWRTRATLNENEQLISPADYVRISIAEKLTGNFFRDFALRVCDERVARLDETTQGLTTQHLLPSLSSDDEVELLDRSDGVASRVSAYVRDFLDDAQIRAFDVMPLLQRYFVGWWAESQGVTPSDVMMDLQSAPATFRRRFDNYKHALLFTLRSGKRGVRKYYAGWDEFILLSGENIRYFLELVDNSLILHLKEGHVLNESISAAIQTKAAQLVGQKNLRELEGLTVRGAQLTRLVLGLGRIFQTMAEQPSGHAPEVNQFHLADEPLDGPATSITDAARELLASAVTHLALVRTLGNKLADEADTREYDYMVHPIFAAFFVFSHRRKRKMLLRYDQLLGLIRSPKTTIREVLEAQNRTSDVPLPDQLALFENYYAADA
jgi:hypothetical protein